MTGRIVLERFPRCYCTCTVAKRKSYSDTVLTPKTKFPLKLENVKLVERDDKINKVCGFDDLYLWQKQHLSGPEFILHDGPLYANGSPHMGHAINKILKDTIIRQKILSGVKVHYVPGWDCHGLPIELKALSKTDNLSPTKIRNIARSFVEHTAKMQLEIFKSWGLLGDWSNAYKTYTNPYVKNQLKQFYNLYKNNFVFRDFKPVYWSPSTRTALAESELEYNENHTSPSTYLRLRIKHIALESLQGKIVYAMIWTTTPWTLLSNQAVCFNPDLSYSFIRKPNEKIIYIVATELVEELSKVLNVNLEILGIFNGALLEDATYHHPIFKEKVLHFLPSPHATSSKGTGLVHCAPAHGPEDFLVGLNNKLATLDLVDELGCYKDEAGDLFKGQFVLTEGNKTVLEVLKDDLLHVGEIRHSYPYDWRSKKPVIIKASRQWFMNTELVKNKVTELLEGVTFIPKSNGDLYKQMLVNYVKKRPYWCISRQRKWGVPIPVMYNESNGNEVIVDEFLIEHYCRLLDENGADYWWELPMEQLIPRDLHNKFDINNLKKGEDIFDIWLDSGLSWSYVLGDHQIADMYLEGVDQFNGWFQSSILISAALRGKSPYKSVYVHGFAVDENGVKMSKSLGNVVDPVVVMKGSKGKRPYGIDTLRWWVVCHASQHSTVNVSTSVLAASSDEVSKIRSILRFIIGSLSDYKGNTSDVDRLMLIDKYLLHSLLIFHEQVNESFENYTFNKINRLVLNLLTNQISSLYFSSIKDRLYCENVDSSSRRNAQFVLLNIFNVVVHAIAPIVPHLAEEAYLYFPIKRNETYFTSKWFEPDGKWRNESVVNLMEVILEMKRDINKELRETGPGRMKVLVSISSNFSKAVENLLSKEEFKEELFHIFQVSQIEIEINEGQQENYLIKYEKSPKFLCDRCRKFSSDGESKLCERCDDVLKKIGEQ